ncbi:MAG: hypothetical protein ACYC9O_12910 [Candidatus Latescibacterota bacterium]
MSDISFLLNSEPSEAAKRMNDRREKRNRQPNEFNDGDGGAQCMVTYIRTS